MHMGRVLRPFRKQNSHINVLFSPFLTSFEGKVMARGLLRLEQVQRKVAPSLHTKLSSQFSYCSLIMCVVIRFSACAQLQSATVHNMYCTCLSLSFVRLFSVLCVCMLQHSLEFLGQIVSKGTLN